MLARVHGADHGRHQRRGQQSHADAVDGEGRDEEGAASPPVPIAATVSASPASATARDDATRRQHLAAEVRRQRFRARRRDQVSQRRAG